MSRTVIIIIALMLSLGAYALVVTSKLATSLNEYSELRQSFNELREQSVNFEQQVIDRDSAIESHLIEIKEIRNAHDLLVNAITAGDFRVYVKASCPVHSEASPPASTPAGGTPELTGTARQDYLDFRVAYQYQLSHFRELQRYCR